VLGTVVISRIFRREGQLIEVHKELEIAQRIQLAMTAVAGDLPTIRRWCLPE
jgi:hypothetical protein